MTDKPESPATAGHSMTVGELIEKLRVYPEKAMVYGSSLGLHQTWHTRLVRGVTVDGLDGMAHPVIQVVEEAHFYGEGFPLPTPRTEQ